MAGERLLLVGAGHGHLPLIRAASRLRAAGYEITLVAPRWFHYSGTASAVAAGDLAAEQGRIDVAALAWRHGVDHLPALVVDLTVPARTALTDAGHELDWDVISLNIGSVVNPGSIRVGEGVVRVKPLQGLTVLNERVCGSLDEGLAVTVVGGGSSGVEIAAHTAARLATSGTPGRVVLVDAGSRLAPNLPRRAGLRLLRHLSGRGVEVRLGTAVQELHAGYALLGDGSKLAHHVAVLATGLAAPALVERAGLGDRRGIPVRATLTHPDHDHVYAVGDCAHFLPQPLPRVGVHGVRQAPVLLEALLARRQGADPPVYSPQAHALAILDLGDGRGLAARGRWWWEGRSALRLKRWIDRRWLAQYQI